VLVGAVTSLPGLVTSVVGAADGDASFAVSNSLGGIAAQTSFLALADLTYRRANLEHAAASLPNLLLERHPLRPPRSTLAER
jgi:cation:H+ antiporter